MFLTYCSLEESLILKIYQTDYPLIICTVHYTYIVCSTHPISHLLYSTQFTPTVTLPHPQSPHIFLIILIFISSVWKIYSILEVSLTTLHQLTLPANHTHDSTRGKKRQCFNQYPDLSSWSINWYRTFIHIASWLSLDSFHFLLSHPISQFLPFPSVTFSWPVQYLTQAQTDFPLSGV